MLVSTVTFYPITRYVTAGNVLNVNLFGAASIVSPQLDKLLLPAGVVNAQSFGAHTLQLGPAKQLTTAAFVNPNQIHNKTIETVEVTSFTTWNPADKSANITLSNSNKTATSTSATDGAVRGAHAKTTGKWYFELLMLQGAASGGNTGGGLAAAAAALGSIGPSVPDSFIYFRGGNVYSDGAVQFNLGGYGGGGRICVAYDADNHRAWVRLNGGNWNGNAANNPATNTGGVNVSGYDGPGLFPCWSLGASNDAVVANFGSTAFTHTVPSGFTGWTST